MSGTTKTSLELPLTSDLAALFQQLTPEDCEAGVQTNFLMVLIMSILEMAQWLWDLFAEMFPPLYMVYNFIPVLGGMMYKYFHVDLG